MAASTNDQPQTQIPRRRGYRRFAAAIAWDPSLMVFPRFREANALNLLCLQAEISALEEKLSIATDRDDVSSDESVRMYSRNFDLLSEHGKESEQWKLHLELRARLKEYIACSPQDPKLTIAILDEALIQQFVINDQISPTRYDYGILQRWLSDSQGGARDFRGAGSSNLFPEGRGGRPLTDLVAVAATNARSDLYTRWANSALQYALRWVPFWRPKYRAFLPDEIETGQEPSLRIYSTSSWVRSAGDKLTSILAAALILVPVIVLRFIQNADHRLIVIVVFSLCFSVAMAFLTDAKRSELFAAAAAFIAVQVVYVGSALSSS